jgi:hypothetical protein
MAYFFTVLPIVISLFGKFHSYPIKNQGDSINCDAVSY